MHIIAVISQKGGAGKTTLSLHLAVAAEAAGFSTVLLDMDPQGTAEAWSEWRKEAPPVVIPAKTASLARTLEKVKGHGADLVVIDTPPLAEAEARSAAKIADLVLVPCRPNAFDIHSIKTTADLTRFAGKPAFVVFNAGPVAAARLYAETTEIVTELGLKVAPIRLSERATFRHSTGSGQAAQETEPSGKAAAEITALWTWARQQAGVTPAGVRTQPQELRRERASGGAERRTESPAGATPVREPASRAVGTKTCHSRQHAREG